MMLMWFVLMILVLVALIVGIVWLVRTLVQDGGPNGRRAIEELELRYARGDIDRDEYFQRRDDLERG